jgi:putative LysE/RhtB family amino acid efflux pump
MHALGVGFGLGFLVALQLGPMSLFLVRSTLRAGWAVGLSIGAGIALIDALYATCGAAGAASLLTIDELRTAFSLLGAAVLLALGARTLRDAFRAREAAGTGTVSSPRRAFATSLAATASNPATIASWAAIFAAAGGADAADAPALLVTGVGLGSLCWVTLLALGTATARRSVGARGMRIADTVAGAGLIAFGCALALF